MNIPLLQCFSVHVLYSQPIRLKGISPYLYGVTFRKVCKSRNLTLEHDVGINVKAFKSSGFGCKS